MLAPVHRTEQNVATLINECIFAYILYVVVSTLDSTVCIYRHGRWGLFRQLCSERVCQSSHTLHPVVAIFRIHVAFYKYTCWSWPIVWRKETFCSRVALFLWIGIETETHICYIKFPSGSFNNRSLVIFVSSMSTQLTIKEMQTYRVVDW